MINHSTTHKGTKRNRFIAVFAVLILSLAVLTACGKEDTEESGGTETEIATEQTAVSETGNDPDETTDAESTAAQEDEDTSETAASASDYGTLEEYLDANEIYKLGLETQLGGEGVEFLVEGNNMIFVYALTYEVTDSSRELYETSFESAYTSDAIKTQMSDTLAELEEETGIAATITMQVVDNSGDLIYEITFTK